MEDYIYRVEVLLDFYTTCLPGYWQSNPYPLERRLEKPSPWNLTSPRKKKSKDDDAGILYI